MEYPPRYERSSKYKDIKNENVASLTEKAKIIFFRSVGFADWFVGLKGYSKFEPKPFWKETGPWKSCGSCSFQEMGSWFKLKWEIT